MTYPISLKVSAASFTLALGCLQSKEIFSRISAIYAGSLKHYSKEQQKGILLLYGICAAGALFSSSKSLIEIRNLVKKYLETK